MKKFSGLILAILCVLVVCFSGCTYADNATLISIGTKYEGIYRNNETIFNGNRLNPSYSSGSLSLVINSENNKYNILKSENNVSNYENYGTYGVLMQSANTTYLSNNALSILSNNDKTNKEYKKQMYLALDSLNVNVVRLKDIKVSLESVFNNDTRDAQVIAEQEIAIYNLKNYKNSLNNCINDLLKFNKNYNLALNNNLAIPVSLEDLLSKSNETLTLEPFLNNVLINNYCLVATNVVLNYYIVVKEDFTSANDLVNILKQLMPLQNGLTVENMETTEQKDAYKIIRTYEDSILKAEATFESNLKLINKNSFNNSNINEENAINYITNYSLQLKNYGEKLIDYIKTVQAV